MFFSVCFGVLFNYLLFFKFIIYKFFVCLNLLVGH